MLNLTPTTTTLLPCEQYKWINKLTYVCLCMPYVYVIIYVWLLGVLILWCYCKCVMFACQPADKMSYKKHFFSQNSQLYNLCCCCWHVGWADNCHFVYTSLSGFLMICLDLVLMTSLPCGIVLLSIEAFVFSCYGSLFATALFCSLSLASPFWLLFVCWWHCPLWSLWLLLYAIGFY